MGNFRKVPYYKTFCIENSAFFKLEETLVYTVLTRLGCIASVKFEELFKNEIANEFHQVRFFFKSDYFLCTEIVNNRNLRHYRLIKKIALKIRRSDNVFDIFSL